MAPWEGQILIGRCIEPAMMITLLPPVRLYSADEVWRAVCGRVQPTIRCTVASTHPRYRRCTAGRRTRTRRPCGASACSRRGTSGQRASIATERKMHRRRRCAAAPNIWEAQRGSTAHSTRAPSQAPLGNRHIRMQYTNRSTTRAASSHSLTRTAQPQTRARVSRPTHTNCLRWTMPATGTTAAPWSHSASASRASKRAP